MKLSSLFQEERVLVHARGSTLREVLHALVSTLRNELDDKDIPILVDEIMAIESRRPTLAQAGICMAHLRTDKIHTFRVALALPEDSVPHPFDPTIKVQAVFLILAPQTQNTLMLQTMAGIARLMSGKGMASTLRNVRSSTRVIRLIEDSGIEVKRNLTAGDIMEPVLSSLQGDTPLVNAVSALSHAHDEGLPVLDERGHLIGEITTKEVLLLGMPKYMDLLSNPEMLNEFEPFESYFFNAPHLKVRDICRRDFGSVAPSAPIVRVAHIMITENRRRVYVLEDDKISGVIYRKSILVKVMNQ